MLRTNTPSTERIVGYAEVLSIWTTRYLDPSGFECLLSLQAETSEEVLTKADGALNQLADNKCLPLKNNRSNNGNQPQTPEKPSVTVQVKNDDNSENPICPIHGIEMFKWTKGNRTWFSHRWNDSWCNGKQR